jgi:hypothetical protein
MAVSAVRRAAAYSSKLDPAVVATRLTARATDMKAEAGASAAEAADLDDKVRSVLGGATAAVSSILVPAYLAFGRKLGKLNRTHNGKTFAAEALLVGVLFFGRGLDADVLNAIALNVFGIVIDVDPA